MFKTLTIQHCGKRIELIAHQDVLLAIKDDRVIQNKVIKPWSVHRIYTKYVLLPADTAKEVLNWAGEAKWNSPDRQTDEVIKRHLNIVKRAIKVQEQNQ